jgi:hypothetical protein
MAMVAMSREQMIRPAPCSKSLMAIHTIDSRKMPPAAAAIFSAAIGRVRMNVTPPAMKHTQAVFVSSVNPLAAHNESAQNHRMTVGKSLRRKKRMASTSINIMAQFKETSIAVFWYNQDMKIAVTGPICKDVIIIDGHINECVGGSTYYESHVLAQLGIEVKVFGTYAKVDDDLMKRNFTGIPLLPIYVDKTIIHELAYSKSNPDVRTVKVPQYSSNTFPTDDNLINEFKTFDYVFLGPLYSENLTYEFFEKMEGSNLVLNNFGLFSHFENGKVVRRNPENLVRVAKFLKYLFLDEEEVKFAAQKETIEEAAKFFLELGTPYVIVTMGSRGSIVFTKEQRYDIPAYPPKELIDPTGAGDTYLAAFIYAEELFKDLQKRGEFAAMAATIAIEKNGAFQGTKEEILERLEKVHKIK